MIIALKNKLIIIIIFILFFGVLGIFYPFINALLEKEWRYLLEGIILKLETGLCRMVSFCGNEWSSYLYITNVKEDCFDF